MMKRSIVSLVSALVFSLVLAACSNGDNNAAQSTGAAPAASPAQSGVPAQSASPAQPTSMAQTADVPGERYKLLQPAQPSGTQKIEVLEFFFYECSHCFHLHPLLSKWEASMPKDVEMGYVPVMFRDASVPLAQTFYALQEMGQQKQLDDAIYQAIHVNNVEMYTPDAIAGFLSKNGVDRAKFDASYQSFSVGAKVARARQMMYDYGIMGTPTLVVDGRYVITGLEPEDVIKTLDQVVAKVRSERGGKR